ncbi:MAG: HAMP domain-containing histidine kinase [Reichenbachiella sp.]
MKNSFYKNGWLTFRDRDFESGFRVFLKKSEIALIEKVVFALFLFNFIYFLKDTFFYTGRDPESMLFQGIVILPVYAALFAFIWFYKSKIRVGGFFFITSFFCVFTILSQLILTLLNGTDGGSLSNIMVITTFAAYIFSGIIFRHLLMVTPFVVLSFLGVILFAFDFDKHEQINLILIYIMTFVTIIWYKFNNEKQLRNSFNQSELMQLEDSQIKESYLEMNAMSEMRKDLISILAHDVRSPLANLHSVISLTKDEDLTIDESKSMMVELESQVDKVEFLINDILVWIKSQSNDAHLEMGTVNLPSITEDLNFIFSDIFKDKGIEFKLDLRASCVFGQEDMIKTVLRNLIGNAIKFSRKGNTITLSSRLEKGLVKVAISDEGVGMNESAIKKIKKTFSTTLGTNSEKGIGLGLKICQAIVRTHKSTLEFKSEVDKGTEVSFFLGEA